MNATNEDRTFQDRRYDDRSTGMGFVCGLLTGVTVGAGLAMLFAPKAGADMRRDLADGASDLGRTAKDTWQEVTTSAGAAVQKGREVYEQAKGTVQNAADTASKSVDRVKTAVKDAADDLSATSGSFPRPAGGGPRY